MRFVNINRLLMSLLCFVAIYLWEVASDTLG